MEEGGQIKGQSEGSEGDTEGRGESYAKNLEEQSRVRVGQGKEEKNVVKWSMIKVVNDSKRQIKVDISKQNEKSG